MLIAMFMAVLDVAVVNVALPTIHNELHATGAGLQLSVSGYTITYAVLIVTGARLGDLWGHGRMFRAGLALFTAASLACGLAPDIGGLIAFRGLQGVGAAAMVPQVLSIIQRTFSGPARMRATSMYTAVIAGGAAVGQVVGGLLVSANLFGSTWRPAFLVNVPIGLAALVISGRVLPKDRGEPGRGLDPVGVAVLTPTVLAFVVPLVLGHDEHWPLWGWLLLAASALGVAAFVTVERRLERRRGTPIIPGRTLALPGFALSIGLMFLVMAVMTGMFFALTLHLQGALGFSALDAGLAGAPAAGAIFVVSMRWRRLPARWYPWLVVAGLVVVALSSFALAGVLHGGTTGGLARWILQAVNGAGLGLAYSPLLGVMLSRIPVSDAADASGVISTTAQVSQVVGIATFGTLFLNLLAQAHLHASAHAVSAVLVVAGAIALLGALLAIRLSRVR
ncbi:MFS transporter [Actinocrinis puniceicyclus]|uniref:MFS transporter n=1 Tax=Actinocrinis puniceicyclus TaxID=977794 RepID=A0A8J7WLQ7_9ACTN|nr:MFS transporter [Actinocrinis puniceicyclus]MBS2964693.1 MFS transporter [Actinocrinis puniceicyclus]